MAAGKGSEAKGGHRLPAAGVFEGQVRDSAGGSWVRLPHPALRVKGTPSFKLFIRAPEDFEAWRKTQSVAGDFRYKPLAKAAWDVKYCLLQCLVWKR